MINEKTRNSTPEVKYAIGNESQSVTIKKESDEISKFRLLEEKVKKSVSPFFWWSLRRDLNSRPQSRILRQWSRS